ncbi:hypothetical protein ACHAWU_007665 [Discostella pseudostelligera]|uniref:Large ribosomal subunit protein bL25 beta domain-containing protein n=1 Tax=Discostella pseudostelligera TaxID=259834 RepID=A0ABD3MDB9_9STRA
MTAVLQRQQLHNRALSTATASAGIITATPPRYAQPDRYVMGVTHEQLASNQAMREWYAANVPNWESEPDKFIIGENVAIETKKEEEDEDNDEEYNPSAIILPEHLTKRNIRPLVAYLRDPSGRESGSRNSRKLRLPSINDPYFPLIPGILHGSDPTHNILSTDPSSKIVIKTPWFEIQRELDRFHYGITGSFLNRVYALTVFPHDEAHLDHHRKYRNVKDRTIYKVDDEKHEIIAIPPPPPSIPPSRTPVPGMENILVLPADLQMHPIGHTSYCLNFIRYHPNKPIKIPIKVTNEEDSPAMKRGGFISMVNRFIEVLVDETVPIPERISLDASGLRQKDVVRRDRLVLPQGVRVHPRVSEDYLIGTVFGAKGGGGGGDDKADEKKK